MAPAPILGTPAEPVPQVAPADIRAALKMLVFQGTNHRIGVYRMKCHVAMFFLMTALAFGGEEPVSKDTIRVGMDLQLGDSKQVVMSRLAEKYTMVKLDGDNWLVKSKSTPSVTYGQVLFENGELTLASKDWTKGDEDSVGFVQSLYDAFDGLGKENKHFCYVQTDTTKTSVAEIRSINLSCGAKELSIETRDTLSGEAKGKSTSIQEVLKK